MSIIHSENIGILNSNFSHNILPLSKKLINITNVLNATIKHCYFDGNIVKVLLYAFHSALLIHNTTFSKLQIPLHIRNGFIIRLINTKLLLSGPVKFHKNRIYYRSIITLTNSTITVHGYIEFSKNYACSLTIHYHDINVLCHSGMIKVEDNTTIAITNNEMFVYFINGDFEMFGDTCHYPQCFFQYFSTNYLDDIHAGNFSIIIENNTLKNLSQMLNWVHLVTKVLLKSQKIELLDLCLKTFENILKQMAITITHCYWVPQSAFNITNPVEVNMHYIQYINNSKSLQMSKDKALCYCSDKKHYNCFKDELNPLYPGQTLTVSFYPHVEYNFTTEAIIAEVDMKQKYATSCKVINAKENMQFIGRNCTEVKYTIAFPTNNWCELFLKLSQKHNTYDIFYIRELPCPVGFLKISGICQCYPSFKLFEFTIVILTLRLYYVLAKVGC